MPDAAAASASVFFFRLGHWLDSFVKTANKYESDSQPNIPESKAVIDFAILIYNNLVLVIDYSVSFLTPSLGFSLPCIKLTLLCQELLKEAVCNPAIPQLRILGATDLG